MPKRDFSLSKCGIHLNKCINQLSLIKALKASKIDEIKRIAAKFPVKLKVINCDKLDFEPFMALFLDFFYGDIVIPLEKTLYRRCYKRSIHLVLVNWTIKTFIHLHSKWFPDQSTIYHQYISHVSSRGSLIYNLCARLYLSFSFLFFFRLIKEPRKKKDIDFISDKLVHKPIQGNSSRRNLILMLRIVFGSHKLK